MSDPSYLLSNQPNSTDRVAYDKLKFWFSIALLSRIVLAVVFQIFELDRVFGLTRDGFGYHMIANTIANHWESHGAVPWPRAVSHSIWDNGYYYLLGYLYYYLGPSMLWGRLVNCICGVVAPLFFWHIARAVYQNERVAIQTFIVTAFFPSTVLYSVVTVRDAISLMSMAMVFWGVVSMSQKTVSFRNAAWLIIGLFLMATLRFYMFVMLLGLIPAGGFVAMIVSGRGWGTRAGRFAMIAVCAIVIGMFLGLDERINRFLSGGFLDLDHLNHVRGNLNKGSGAMFKDSSAVGRVGESIWGTITGVGLGLYFFFFSVNPLEIQGHRQFMVMPEVLLVCIAVPSLFRGFKYSWIHHRDIMIPLMVVAFGVTVAYSSITTNSGPMLRWRLQVMNIYILIAIYGWEMKNPYQRSTYHQPIYEY